VRNNALSGITNITQLQANILMTASGFMPASFIGGNNNNPVYFVGRDSGSGTRLCTEKCINFIGSPLLWTTNGSGGYVVSPGLSSGGLVRGIVASQPDAVGYLGLPDYNAVSNNATIIPFNGIKFSHTNVNNGSYAIWGYEHLVNRAGALSVQKAAVRDAIKSAITNPGYQATNSAYFAGFSSLSDMRVERGADGAIPTSVDF
jgi:phosphate transport system substrate-binding protein